MIPIFCLKVLCKSRIARHTECSIFLSSVIAFSLSCYIVFSSTVFILMKSGVPLLPVMLVSYPRNLFLIQGLEDSRLWFSALLSLALRFIFNYSICVSSCVHGHPVAHGYLISIPIVWTHLLNSVDLNGRAARLSPRWLLCLLCQPHSVWITAPLQCLEVESEPSSRAAHQRACCFYLTYDKYF